MPQIKNIIFDLGGVLLDIDYNKTTLAFRQLGVQNFNEQFSQSTANELFERLETGDISEGNFYTAIQQHCQPGTSTKAIENAWNALLLNFRVESLDYLSTLAENYNLFLLSNTNSIHQRAFQHILQAQTRKNSLDTYFQKSYYSHLIHKRKPYPATYQFVLNDGNMNAGETLFVDDSIINIEGAKDTGIITRLLLPAETIETLQL